MLTEELSDDVEVVTLLTTQELLDELTPEGIETYGSCDGTAITSRRAGSVRNSYMAVVHIKQLYFE